MTGERNGNEQMDSKKKGRGNRRVSSTIPLLYTHSAHFDGIFDFNEEKYTSLHSFNKDKKKKQIKITLKVIYSCHFLLSFINFLS